MGTPEFAVPSLTKLVAADFSPVAVVTGPDRPRGRGRRIAQTPVKQQAKRLGVSDILQPESVGDPAFVQRMLELRPDVIVVVAFRILPVAVFGSARIGAFNLHASLLPRWRGAAPIHRAIMAGDSQTGVTTFFLRKKVDTGSIILRWPLSIGPNETYGELHDRLSELGSEVVLETVRRLAAGPVETIDQDDTLATAAPKIFRSDCRIPWHKSAAAVHNHCRGLSPHPGAWTRHNETTLKIQLTRPVHAAGAPGEILVADGKLTVACGRGAVEIQSLQQEGRRQLSVADFLRGYELRKGEQLHAAETL